MRVKRSENATSSGGSVTRLKHWIIKRAMLAFSRVGKIDPTWAGYSVAGHAATQEEREHALLSISRERYRQSIEEAPLDQYFRKELRPLLEGRNVLEIGSNHGGAALAYFQAYNLRSITGVDTTDSQTDTSSAFFAEHGVPTNRYKFVVGSAEALPFETASFDAVISFDVLEHVPDPAKVLTEAHRVLRTGGIFLLVFPSYYHPTQHHLFDVTSAPFLHWFFSAGDIMKVFWEILDDNPEHRDRLGLHRRPRMEWEKLYEINGTTLHAFRRMLKKDGWSAAEHIPLPFGAAGTKVHARPALELFRFVCGPATRIPLFDEVVNQRIVYILTK